MGNSSSALDDALPPDANRDVFVCYVSRVTHNPHSSMKFVVFKFVVKYRRFRWELDKRFHEIMKLEKYLRRYCTNEMLSIPTLQSFNKLFFNHDEVFLDKRCRRMMVYLQRIVDNRVLFASPVVRDFLSIGAVSFRPEMGRKGKEGYMSKCSGGYVLKFSRQSGDFFNYWRTRWFVLYDTHISWYRSPDDSDTRGSLAMGQHTEVLCIGRIISIKTQTRKLSLSAATRREADEWREAIVNFYSICPRKHPQKHLSSFPPHDNCDVRVYTYSKDYMANVATAMLGASKEILITSWKNSPCVQLSRPPNPPVRLDQLLRFKAEQGVKIFILLYKEVEMAGQGNDSGKALQYLESLSPNIKCIRHPNKFMGGSTAVLWSHHEKTVVVDRNVAFVGGIDLAFNRWDDEHHDCVDEDGIKFPGRDYRQPGEGSFKRVRNETSTGIKVMGLNSATDLEAFESQYSTANSYNSSLAPSTQYHIPAAATTAAFAHVEPNNSERLSNRATGLYDVDEDGYSFGEGNVNEGKNEPLTPDELAARKEAELNANDGVMNKDTGAEYPPMGGFETPMESNGQVADAYAISEAGTECTPNSLPQSTRLGTAFNFMSTGISSLYEAMADTYTVLKENKGPKLETRETYPRMPWHDVHAAVSGAPARDVAFHFIQRWNHHRLATNQPSKLMSEDITDNTKFGVCARCDMGNLSEAAFVCPSCGYQLGPISSYLTDPSPFVLPPALPTYSYITFTCLFGGDYGFNILGEGPTVLSSLYAINNAESYVEEGQLHAFEGEHAQKLMANGLFPAVGDVVMLVDGAEVMHLDYLQTTRLIIRRRQRLGSERMGICFRRHYLMEHNSVPSSIAAVEAVQQDVSADAVPNTFPQDVYAGSMPSSTTEHSTMAAEQRPSFQPVVVPQSGTRASLQQPSIQAEVQRPAPLTQSLYQTTATTNSSSLIPSYLSATEVQQLSSQPSVTNTVAAVPTANYTNSNAPAVVLVPDPVPAPVVVAPPTYQAVQASTLPAVPTYAPLPQVPGHAVVVPTEEKETVKRAYARSGVHRNTDKKEDSDDDSHDGEFDKHTGCTNANSSVAGSRSSNGGNAVVYGEVDNKEVHKGVLSKGKEGIVPMSPAPRPTSMRTNLPIAAAAAYATPSGTTMQTPVVVPAVVEAPRQTTTSHYSHHSSQPEVTATAYVYEGVSNNGTVANVDSLSWLRSTMVWAGKQQHVLDGQVEIWGNGAGGGLSNAALGVPPICRMSASMEMKLCMSNLYHQSSRYTDLVNKASDSGTCQVQVLRSTGPWSIGTRVENSIMQCWKDTIASAQRLIYIENQFFISSLGGGDIRNPIADTIVQRIVNAYHAREPLRVIIIIPQHPNGDIAGTARPRIILHYQCMTINKGMNSLYSQLRARLPGVNPADYIEFFCLKSWGVLNDKVVSDQIYVHDKLLIVDDRVAIVGSANINDRSMLGDRDSEMAIRIEDTRHVTIQFAGKDWIAGYLPHTLRMRLMGQHVANTTADLVDMVNPHVYQAFWRNVAQSNSSCYDQLDGESSVYKCGTLAQYVSGIQKHSYLSIRDPATMAITNQIQGFLLMWPLEFLLREDTSPSVGTKAVVPTDLWV